MNAAHSVSHTSNVAQVVSIRKNQYPRGEILTVRFGGEQPDYIQPRPAARASESFLYGAKRGGINGCGHDLFFAEWDFVD